MRKIIYLFSSAVFFSCAKDAISIEKNINTDWEVDNKVVEEDIRSRIGYDPSMEYVYIPENYTDIPMISFSNLNIVENNVRDIDVTFINALQKDCSLALEYDPTIFDKIKASLPDYELGEAELVKIDEPQKDVVKGTEVVKFKVEVANNSSFRKKLAIPFALKVKRGDNIKIFEEKSFFVVKIYPEDIVLDLPSSILQEGTMEYGEITLSSYAEMEVKTSRPIPSNVKIGFVRDNDLLPSGSVLAPESVEDDLMKFDFQNVLSKDILLQFNTDVFTEKGTYVLPLKLMMYDESGNSYDIPDSTVLVTFRIQSKPNVNSTISPEVDIRWKSVNKKAISVSGSDGTRFLERLIDDLNYNGGRIYPGVNPQAFIEFRFSSPRAIKGMVLQMPYGPRYPRPDKIKVTSIKDSAPQEQEQGIATFDSRYAGYYKITFERPLYGVNAIKLSDFFKEGGMASEHINYFMITEVTFFE
ncbi:hypothetical protein ACILE9_10075 [Capnocytophaga cynodegmi]|uniref:hypothetical protein n=1 Tax=Capnocytophaga cynodegmi TaxID=28189 RepID=UPI0037D7260B